MNKRLAFFLGGHDLEMLTIRDLLEAERSPFHDKGLSWGGRASTYEKEIRDCLAAGDTPVLVELPDDMGLSNAAVVVVDHHGPRAGAGAPTSLHQVFDLLRLPRERWTRWHELVAANDAGYIPGLTAAGATHEEIARVRAADRAAQGITADEEREAERAVAAAESLCGGRLTVVRAAHGRLAAVEDRLHAALGGPGVENLLLLSPGAVDFSGDGRLVQALDHRFPGGWSGGNLPEQGFWGCSRDLPEVLPFVAAALTTSTGAANASADCVSARTN